jgi:hypothetical protein
MAPDAGTSPQLTPSRKRRTLEDVRRELDAEYPPPQPVRALPRRADLDHDEGAAEEIALEPGRRTNADRHLPAPVRATPWRGYVTAGAIGCIIGQLLILGSFAVARYGTDIIDAQAPPSGPRLTAPLLRVDAEAPAAPSASISPAASRLEVATPDAMGAPADAIVPTAEGVAPTASPARPAASLAADRTSVESQRGSVRRSPPPPPQLRRPLRGLDDWVESQARLRSALREWVAMSSRADIEVHVTDAEVILGADGWTAKTRLPMTSRAGVVVREQRWELGPDGWSIVEDREVERHP